MKSRSLEAALLHRLGYHFSQPDLLRQALTHRSFGAPHNERLEFLGDAILNCCVASLLYQRFPVLKEGDLSRFRANLVRQESLVEIAQHCALGDCLLLGEGELKSGGAQRPSMLADALEALFGAIYLDAGFDAVFDVIGRLYAPALSRIDPLSTDKDPKTALQELLQGRHLPLPRYVLLKTRGEAHAQEFEVECQVPDLGVRGIGVGSSRRLAEQQAANRAIAEIRS